MCSNEILTSNRKGERKREKRETINGSLAATIILSQACFCSIERELTVQNNVKLNKIMLNWEHTFISNRNFKSGFHMISMLKKCYFLFLYGNPHPLLPSMDRQGILTFLTLTALVHYMSDSEVEKWPGSHQLKGTTNSIHST